MLKDDAEAKRAITYIGLAAGPSDPDATPEEHRAEIATIAPALVNLAESLSMDRGSAVAAFDTLVASGMNLKEAFDYLPTVLKGAQASGARPDELANTLLTTYSTFGLDPKTTPPETVLDQYIAGGQSGKMELPDMAAFAPEVAASMAPMGYQGPEAVTQMIAALEMLREGTGSSGAAATQMRELMGKITAPATVNAAKTNFGVDDYDERFRAKVEEGLTPLVAAVDLAREITGSDLTQLNRLYADQQARLGMNTLMRGQDDGTWDRFRASASPEEAGGTADRNLELILGDTAAALQDFDNIMDRVSTTLGETLGGYSRAIADAMDDGTVSRENAENFLLGPNLARKLRERRDDAPTPNPHPPEYDPPAIDFAPWASPENITLNAGRVEFGEPRPAPDMMTTTPTMPPPQPSTYAQPPRPYFLPPAMPIPSATDTTPGSTPRPEASATLDTSALDASAAQAGASLDQLGRTVRASADLDIGPLMAKVEQANAALDALEGRSARVGSGGGGNTSRQTRNQLAPVNPGGGG